MILVKFPSRERPKQFIENLKKCIELSTLNSTSYLISLDLTDPNHEEYQRLIAELNHPNISLLVCYSKNKIHAVNRDLPEYKGKWDIVVVVSDDQIPQVKGWDERIASVMQMEYPDTNGSLWFYDGYQSRINTQCIIGKKYYERFGYIYHPSYKSLWCDNEFTEVSSPVTYKSDLCIFKHEHYSNNNQVKIDAMMKRTEGFYKEDGDNFKRRKANGFK